MKTLTLQIDDSLYDAFIVLLKQLPENKVSIIPSQSPTTRLGGMIGTGEIIGDIVEPTENLEQWTALQ